MPVGREPFSRFGPAEGEHNLGVASRSVVKAEAAHRNHRLSSTRDGERRRWRRDDRAAEIDSDRADFGPLRRAVVDCHRLERWSRLIESHRRRRNTIGNDCQRVLTVGQPAGRANCVVTGVVPVATPVLLQLKVRA